MATVIPDLELTAFCDVLLAFSDDMASKTDLHKSLLGVFRLDMDGISLTVAKSSADRDLDSKLLPSLVYLVQGEIHGLQNQLASFAAKIENLGKDLQIMTNKTIMDWAEVMNRQRNLVNVIFSDGKNPFLSVQR